jgi:hypothetical protein
MLSTRTLALACVAICGLGTTACGSSGSSSSTSATSPSPASSSTAAPSGSNSGSGALSADANSAATGDIPDTQNYLVFSNRKAGYSMKYPEGWSQLGSADNVTFRDKNNLVRVKVSNGTAPTPAAVTGQLKALSASSPTLAVTSVKAISLGGQQAVKATYSTESAPNAVTGKRVLLLVDRYALSKGGKVATVDLGTPKGVDNVDAYRMMIQSFRWQ